MATGISGLEANGQALSVISDNIANVNTTGFKSSRGEFQNILAQDLMSSGTGAQIGRGATMAGVTNIFTQGSVTKSERSTDLAISGNGFFMVKSHLGTTFTRDGSFRFDKEGWLTNLNGARVQAYEAHPNGKITGKITDIRIPYNTIPAKPTKGIEMHTNLDARLPISLPLDITRPEETAQFTSAIEVFDSIGNNHSLTMYFNKTGDSTWEWNAMTDGKSLAGGIAGEMTSVAQGALNFDPTGKLLSSEQTINNTSFANGAIPDQEMFFSFGDPIDEAGTGERGTTQYGSKNATFRNVQDGFGAGVLSDTSIDADGLVTGVYTNGQNRMLGQLAVARFEATERLSKLGENQFRESTLSGQPLIGKSNTNGRGVIMPKSIETSNVDLANEFVQMIKAQRGFQAAAKTVTSANEMLDEVINLKNR